MSRTKGFLGRFANLTGKRKLTSILVAVLVLLVIAFLFRQNLAKLFSGADENPNLITNQASLSYIDSQSSPKTVDSNIVNTLIATPVPSPSPTTPPPTSPPAQTTFTFSNAGWYLFSLSSQPVNPDPAVVFSGLNLAGGIIYSWDNASQGLLSYDPEWSPDAFVIEAGKGYWVVISGANVGQTISYASTPITTAKTVDISKAGWAIVGNPFANKELDANSATDIKFIQGDVEKNWADAVAAGWVDCTGYKWDSENQGMVDAGPEGCWTSTTNLEVNHGMWVRIYVDGVSIVFTP